jgi:hypothetical protein
LSVAPSARDSYRQLGKTVPTPFWSLDKPKEDEDVSNVVEQVIECKNSARASRFTVYWYDK